jgi:hypothetical protein
MKNIYGLENAMKVVESACEKGEITIIGEGATPSAVVLYGKCVDYINKMYGVDILNLVAKKAAEPAPKVEECKIGLLFDLDEIECFLDDELPKHLPFLDDEMVEGLASDIVRYCKNRNEDGGVNRLSCQGMADAVEELISCKFNGLSAEVCEEVGDEIGSYIMDNFAYLHCED